MYNSGDNCRLIIDYACFTLKCDNNVALSSIERMILEAASSFIFLFWNYQQNMFSVDDDYTSSRAV